MRPTSRFGKEKLMRRSAHRIAVAVATLLTLVAPCARATNLVSNGEFSQFTQGGPNEFLADNNFAPDAKLLNWSDNRPFVAVYAPNSSELIGATGPSYGGGPITLWGPLNGSNNGFTDTSPNQASDPTANFIAMDGDPGFPGTGISQTIGTPLIAGHQYTLSYYWVRQSGFRRIRPHPQRMDCHAGNATTRGWQHAVFLDPGRRL